MRRKTRNIVHILQNRERAFRVNSTMHIDLQKIAEEKAASSEMEEIHCKLPSSVRSTFLMSFSPDCTRVASTHGDHKIYVCDVKTGKLLHKLEGHPRTPWCLAFHPTSNDILASGCLGGEVRVWDLHGGSEKWGAEQSTVITSLAFHPFDKVLVIATFNQIHFWNWNLSKPFATCHTNSPREKIRFVKFDHLGTRLITGILNHPEVVSDNTSSSNNASPSRSSEEPVSYSSALSHRRSLWTRLMNIYQHIDGMEEVARLHDEHNPTMPEEALNRARHYAEATTQATRLQRQLIAHHMSSPSTSSSQSSSQSSTENREGTGSHEEFLVRAFWRTFNRLRAICNALERRMLQLRRSNESQNNDFPVSPPSPSSLEMPTEPPPAGDPNGNRPYSHATSEYLINILTRLQNSLQFSAVANSVPPEQIQQLQWRISEILERLTNVTGYRARLTTLREHIFEVAERSERRVEGISPISRQDLAHCLALVEMSLHLTRQMQRILHEDYRLTRLHLRTTSHSPPPSTSRSADTSSSSSSSSSVPRIQPTISLNCAVCGHRSFTDSNLTEHLQPRVHLQNLFRRDREVRFRVSSSNPRYELWTYGRAATNSRNDIENPEVTDAPVPNLWPRVVLTRAVTDIHSALTATNTTLSNVTQNDMSSDSSDDDDDDTAATLSRRTSGQMPTMSIRLRHLRNGDLFRVSVPNPSVPRYTYAPTTPLSGSDTRRSHFYIPEVQIEPSPSSDDLDPLPVQDRPRSPPLSTILSGSNDFSSWQHDPFFSTWHPYIAQAFYEVSRRPLFGLHEPGTNCFHRIQAWDFSKYDIPVITNAKANIVVPKCKIHNDASVDISQDGEILVALVPSGVSPDLLTFAIYSLKKDTLGQCLYTSAYDANAISVSFSPLHQYVVVGLATPRISFSSSEKEAVAHIYKLKSFGKHWIAINVRSLSHQSTSTSQNSQVSLNSVQWLPQPGHGLIYGTNKGCLCICKPVAPIASSKPTIFKLFSPEAGAGFYSSNSYGRNNDSMSSQQMFSASTQTTEPETQTTGTQTLGSDGNSSASR